jgi:exopolyphosphatase/guanosine-5'-triphosphate,3'-diphosphate pyrophosphatase
MRLGQRLSGGLAGPLETSRLSRDGGDILLTLPKRERDLYGETVDRRLVKLATSLGCGAGIRTS